jgi:hypothetical protein
MKARRITIMLVLTALTALTLFVISLLGGEAQAATGIPAATLPDTLALYRETIEIGPDGNARVDIVFVVADGGSGDLLLPFDFDDAESLAILSGPATFGAADDGAVRPVVTVLGRRMLHLRTEAAAAGDTVRLAARVPGWYDRDAMQRPFGEFALARRYTNYSTRVLRDFGMELILPPGMVVHAVEMVDPAYNPKKNPTPPYLVARDGERTRITLQATNLAPAGTTRLALSIRPARRGPIPLIIGVVFAVLYLVFFRDVLKPKETE